jgi:Family of unknown function (DUF6090)
MRFLQHPRTEWLRYGLESLAVLVGILAAFELDNWNENRQIRNTEQLLLGNLKLEITANQDRLSEAMLYHSKSRESAKRILEIYGDVNPIENYREIDSLLALIQWAWTYDPSMGALNSIKLSGNLITVHNAALRALITDYEDRINDAREENKIIQDLIINKFIPAVNQYISMHQRALYLGEEYAFEDSNFTADYKGLFEDRILEGIISYIYIWRIDEFKEEEQLKQMMEEFISTLNKES